MVVMGTNIAANGVNVVLNYLMIFGVGPFPELGIAGAGWATVIGSWLCPTIFAFIYFTGSVNREFRTWKNLRFNPWLFKRMLRFGFPSGVHWFLDVAAFTVFVLLVGRMGAIAHIASNIALSINLVAFMPMIGMGIAASILVGQYLGRNEPEHAERVGWLAMKIGITYILVIGLSFVLFPKFYIDIFDGESAATVSYEELLFTVRILMIMLAIWGAADATAIVLSGCLKGAGDTHFVMYFQSSVAWGVLVLGQLVIVLWLKLNIFFSWAWTVLYILILGVGYFWRFKNGKWKTIDLLDRKNKMQEPEITEDLATRL